MTKVVVDELVGGWQPLAKRSPHCANQRLMFRVELVNERLELLFGAGGRRSGWRDSFHDEAQLVGSNRARGIGSPFRNTVSIES
jgi:hypothetical protein